MACWLVLVVSAGGAGRGSWLCHVGDLLAESASFGCVALVTDVLGAAGGDEPAFEFADESLEALGVEG